MPLPIWPPLIPSVTWVNVAPLTVTLRPAEAAIMDDLRVEVGIAGRFLLHLGIVGEADLVLETGIQLACCDDHACRRLPRQL